MRALQGDIAGLEEIDLPASIPVDYASVSNEAAALDFRRAAEQDRRGRNLLCHGCRLRVAGVQHGKILGALIHEDPLFGGHIGFEARVPVQVIRRHIQNSRDFGPELLNILELKAGKFRGIDVIGRGARVYLPVNHPGALLWIGDVHATQGDGELSGLHAAEPEVYGIGTVNFSTQIETAKTAQAEAWIAFGQVRDAADMVKSFRKQGYAPAMFVAQGAADPQFIRLLGQDAEHALGILAWDRGFGARETRRFAEIYARRWSAEPTLLAAQGYAAAKVLEEAVRRAGSLEQDRIRDELLALEVETPLGRYKVDKSGAQLGARPAVVQIQAGRRQVVWPEDLATAKWQLPYPRWQERKLLR